MFPATLPPRTAQARPPPASPPGRHPGGSGLLATGPPRAAASQGAKHKSCIPPVDAGRGRPSRHHLDLKPGRRLQADRHPSSPGQSRSQRAPAQRLPSRLQEFGAAAPEHEDPATANHLQPRPTSCTPVSARGSGGGLVHPRPRGEWWRRKLGQPGFGAAQTNGGRRQCDGAGLPSGRSSPRWSSTNFERGLCPDLKALGGQIGSGRSGPALVEGVGLKRSCPTMGPNSTKAHQGEHDQGRSELMHSDKTSAFELDPTSRAANPRPSNGRSKFGQRFACLARRLVEVGRCRLSRWRLGGWDTHQGRGPRRVKTLLGTTRPRQWRR